MKCPSIRTNTSLNFSTPEKKKENHMDYLHETATPIISDMFIVCFFQAGNELLRQTKWKSMFREREISSCV